MNKSMFFTGLIFQAIHLSIFVIVFLSTIDWSFITDQFVGITLYIIFNLVSLGMMLGGLRE